MSSHVGEATINIGIIGFGEVGKIFADGILKNHSNANVYVYDILLEKNHSEIIENIKKIGATPVKTIIDLSHACDMVFSLVNSSASIHVAQEFSKELNRNVIFIDLTTSTPQDKNMSETYLVEKNGKYIDGAIMGTVATEKNKVPLLLSGNHASLAEQSLAQLGFNCQVVELPNGASASIKLLRSIFMKGLEALLLETAVTAKNYGVYNEVLESVAKTLNNNEFKTFGNALIKTHMIHKTRRYKEVQDSLKLIKDAHLESFVTDGVVSFFSNSVNMEFEPSILESDNVDHILDYYLSTDAKVNS